MTTYRKLLTRYCDFVRDNSSDQLVSVESWEQTVYLRPNGDVREVLVIKAIALRFPRSSDVAPVRRSAR